jgi:hypothetical protein
LELEEGALQDNYSRLVQANLTQLYQNLPIALANWLPAEQEDQAFSFKAFGNPCRIEPQGITLNDAPCPSIMGILISLYALHACGDDCVAMPFKAFKELKDSYPYSGAFSTHTENVLVPHAARLRDALASIAGALGSGPVPADVNADVAFTVYPLPKIALCYIVYEADEDFPAAVTCLYSNNADRFLPIDALADVGEYTSKTLIDLIAQL